MTALPIACGGFLLAVLWFDLMFDVQVLRHRGETLPEPVLDSIAAYYRRVTTAGRPMNRLVAFAMVETIAAIVLQVVRGDAPRWAAWTSLVLVGTAVALAAVRTVPGAQRLGAQRDPLDVQSRIARTVYKDHVLCAALIVSLLVVQLCFAT